MRLQHGCRSDPCSSAALLSPRVCPQARALVNQVAATQPRVADKVRDLQDRSRALQQRCIKQLTEKW
jgi:hypothetical protein